MPSRDRGGELARSLGNLAPCSGRPQRTVAMPAKLAHGGRDTCRVVSSDDAGFLSMTSVLWNQHACLLLQTGADVDPLRAGAQSAGHGAGLG